MSDNQTKIGRRFPGVALVVLLGAGGLWWPAPAAAIQNAPGQAGDQQQALRTRVEEFYSLLQRRQMSQAEAYVTEDSLEAFRNQRVNTFLAFQVESIKLTPDGRSATVVVNFTVFTPYVPKPISFPRTRQWRLEEDDWRMVVPPAAPTNPQSLFTPGALKGSASPPPEELKFKGHRYGLGKMRPGEVKTARFPFTNVTDHLVTITEVSTGCDCLRVKTEKMEYQPGESGELVIEFDSTGYEYRYVQTIIVKTDPGNLTTHLLIGGQVIPLQFTTPKP